MKNYFTIVAVVLAVSCNTAPKKPVEDCSHYNPICPRHKIDTLGTDIVELITDKDCKIIFRQSIMEHGLKESYFYDEKEKLVLKIVESDTSKYYCVPDVLSQDFYISFYTGEAIYQEYLKHYERDSRGESLCPIVENGDTLQFNSNISNYMNEYYDHELTRNELNNLFFYIKQDCSPPL